LAFLSAGILIAVIFGLPEGQQPDLSLSLRPGPILGEFFTVLKTRLFYTNAFIGSISLGGLLTYVSGSPQVFMEVFHVNGKEYGWIFAFLSVGLIGASQINSIMLKKYQSKHLITVALICQSITGIILLTGTINSWLGLGGTIFLIFIFLACVGFILPNTSALAMMPFSKNAGSASSLMGALQMGMGTLASISLSLLNDHSAVPMTAIMMGSAVVALLFSILTGSTQEHTGRKKGYNSPELYET
ncbi:MAG TPA: Bcr/CflA family drug resistance efflux transporter, partial [Sphingobacteriaceae bacterium]